MSENGEKETQRRGDPDAKAWAHVRAGEFGAAVKFWRTKMDISAVELSNRTKEKGYPITRATIAKIESNQRNSKMDFLEVCVLAAALEVTPSDLVFWGYPDRKIAITPRSECSALEATAWFIGDPGYNQFADIHNPRLTQSQRHEQTLDNFNQAVQAFESRYAPTFYGAQGEWLLTANVPRGETGRSISNWAKVGLEERYAEIKRLRDEHLAAGGNVDLPGWIDTFEQYGAPF